MNIEIGKKYVINKTSVEVLAYNSDNEVLLVKETDGNLVFVLGNFIVKDSNIISTNQISYTVNETEMSECIKDYLKDNLKNYGEAILNTELKSLIVKGIQQKYYKIYTQLAEVVAEWYMGYTA
jgi:hypothetical protein